jgi:DHA1 family bicyclomycin/chloramphenicol resistance-like MFS transporter
MGELAGTAASVIGFLTSVGGAVLATITDRRLGGTVAPLALGYLVYSVIAYCCQLMALRRPASAVQAIIPG